MAYFPMFVDLENRIVLIVGGGTVAARKAEKLLPFGSRIRVVAPQICGELEAMDVECIRRGFEAEDVCGAFAVITATDDAALNARVSGLCKAKGIPVNSVDDAENCTFLFPSLVKRGKLTVGISTSGASPTAAIWLKEQVEGLLPENMEEILDYLASLRLKNPAGKQRQKLLAAAFAGCMERGRALTEEEEENL